MMTHQSIIFRAFIAIMILTIVAMVAADENAETLKCLVEYLKQKGVHEEFFSSIKTPPAGTNCQALIEAKLTKALGKIHDKLKSDPDFVKYSSCIINAIKTEDNKAIILQREAIKLNGLGVQVWNYFDQRDHLDELKKKTETAINRAAPSCISVY